MVEIADDLIDQMINGHLNYPKNTIVIKPATGVEPPAWFGNKLEESDVYSEQMAECIRAE
jgi:hypothetical protein